MTDEELREHYEAGTSIRVLAKQADKSTGYVRYRLFKQGVVLRPTNRNPNTEATATSQRLRELYESGLSVRRIMEQTGLTESTVYYRLGITRVKKHRLHDLNYRIDRFQSVETPEDAYWLGLLCADGCVSETSGVILNLHEKDRATLEAFCDYLGLPYERIRTLKHSMLKVQAGGSRFAPRLAALGCPPRKTYILQPPPLEDPTLIQAYIKGYYHGDGHLSWKNGKYPIVGICSGNESFLQWVADEIGKLVPHKSRVRFKQQEAGSVYTFALSCRKAETILRYWDTLPTPSMPRKQLP